jgi:hypothetical protein
MRLRLLSPTLVLLCLIAPVSAQDQCDAEIKVLVEPTEVQSVVKALNAGPPAKGEIYLFDTQNREMFSRGVIVRARKAGTISDLMVKVRIPTDRSMSVSGLGAGYKCEVDRTGDSAVRSYSVKTKLRGELPVSGNEVLKLLTPAQRRLLADAHVSPDWSRVQKVASIYSTAWKIRNEAGLSKLSLELWQWSSNQVLELSTKVQNDDASVSTQLRKLVTDKGLSLSKAQTQKTRLAVDGIE